VRIFYFLILLFGYSFGANYSVDVANSKVEFKVKHMFINTVSGSFKKFAGSFSWDETSKQFSNFVGSVDIATVSTKSQKRDDFIKSVDFFDMEKYPTMKLRLLEHNGDKVIMELTIKDITKNIKMQIKDIKEGSFTLHGEINRKDFQLKFNKVGDATVGNTVKIRLKIEGVLTN